MTTTDWTPAEPEEVLDIFREMLRAATGDGAKKRQAGEKPSWKIDAGHETALFHHLWAWKNAEMVDPDSGAHPLVHLAWRALAIAYQEGQGTVYTHKHRKPPKVDVITVPRRLTAEDAARIKEVWAAQGGGPLVLGDGARHEAMTLADLERWEAHQNAARAARMPQGATDPGSGADTALRAEPQPRPWVLDPGEVEALGTCFVPNWWDRIVAWYDRRR